MALDRFNENMDIIGGLGDDPKLDDGLSTPQFKSVFDKAGLLIQKFLNEKLIPQIENFLDEGTVLGKIAEALSGKLDKTGGTMEGPINMNGQTLSGLNAPTQNDHAANKGYVDQQVKEAAPRNLLDNSDFRNPVNQRGQTSYTSVTYGLDRWKTNMGANMTVTVGSGKITLSKANGGGDFMQVLPLDLTGKTITYALKTGRGITLKSAVVTSSSSLVQIDGLKAYLRVYAIDGTTVFGIYFNDTSAVELDLYWAALYEGEYTADNLPVYQPKGYGAELTECQRYFWSLNEYYAYSAANHTEISIILPIIMRITPTIEAVVNKWTGSSWTYVNTFTASASKSSIRLLTDDGPYNYLVSVNVSADL